MAITEQIGFDTLSGNCTILETEQMYVIVVVQAEYPGIEYINTYKVAVRNASGQCVKAFSYSGVVLINTIYDWRSPKFSLPRGVYSVAVVAHSITIGPTTPEAQNGEVLQEVAC